MCKNNNQHVSHVCRNLSTSINFMSAYLSLKLRSKISFANWKTWICSLKQFKKQFSQAFHFNKVQFMLSECINIGSESSVRVIPFPLIIIKVIRPINVIKYYCWNSWKRSKSSSQYSLIHTIMALINSL